MKLLNSLPPYNLFGLDNQNYNNSKIIVLPIPYDSTVTYRNGARNGPGAIIEASRNLELYNMEVKRNVSDIGIYTTEFLAPDFNSPLGMIERVYKESKIILDNNKIPLVLGGEHTVAIGLVKAVSEINKKFSILHFDAHSDSRDELFGSRYSHACVISRMKEYCKDYFSIGIRSIEEESMNNQGNRIISMNSIRELGIKNVVEFLNKNTSKNIYMTFDFDVIDPSEMPSVGTPEPDGLHFNQIMDIFKGFLPQKNLIGMDFTELAPIPGFIAPDYLAAKLIYTLLGYAYLSDVA